MLHSWRYVQPGLNQSAVVLMRDDDVQCLVVPLSLSYIDHQGWRVPMTITVEQSIARWRWRLNVK